MGDLFDALEFCFMGKGVSEAVHGRREKEGQCLLWARVQCGQSLLPLPTPGH